MPLVIPINFRFAYGANRCFLDQGTAQRNQGITLIAFVTALNVSLIVFGVQTGFFLLLRNKLSRILYASPLILGTLCQTTC